MPSLPFDSQAGLGENRPPVRQSPDAGWLAQLLPAQLLPQLGTLFRGQLRMRLVGESILTRAKFAGSIEHNSCCYCISLGRSAGGTPDGNFDFWLEITPSIAFPMINCLLGGPSDDAFILRRPLTAIERRVLGKPVGIIASALRKACPGLSDAANAQAGINTKAIIGVLELPIAADRDEPVASATFELALDSQLGMIRICQASGASARAAVPAPPPARKDSPMEISAILAETPIDPRDMEGLSVGDIITTDSAAGSEVILRVAGIPKFVGKLGICNGHRAVTILRRL
jgi:flagellar motor switch protein FliM